MYDNQNVFAKIIRGEIPSKKIYENEHAFSFYDISPMFTKHVLIIPKGEYENALDFSNNASDAEKLAFSDCFSKTAAAIGVTGNFNVFANAGTEAPFIVPSVDHFHMHLVAGDRTEEFKKLVK